MLLFFLSFFFFNGFIVVSYPQVLREVPADETAHTALAVSHSGRVVFTGTSSGTVRAIKYPLPIQKEWMTYQAHSGPVTKVSRSTDLLIKLIRILY